MNRLYLTLLLLINWSLGFSTELTEKNILHPDVDTLFLDLPAHKYPITSERMPVYATTFKVGKVNTNTQFDISLSYPEYQPLKGEEIKWVKHFGTDIKEEISIDHHLSYSRKIGYIDVAFAPFVKKENKYFRLVSCKINIKEKSNTVKLMNNNILSENEETRWKQQSVLKEGKWVKIRVKKEGIYTLTPSFLSKMGFSNPDKVKLFGYGGRILEENWKFGNDNQVSDDLEEVPLFRKENGESLFFAEGTVRWTYNNSKRKWIHENNPYSNYSYYFVTEGENPSQFAKIKSESSPNKTINSIPYYAVEDHDAFGWYTGGREMYDDYDFSYGPSHSFKLALQSIDTTNINANIDISFSASSSTSSTNVAISHNEKKLGNMTIPKFSNFQSAYEIRKNFMANADDENKFTFNVSPANPARLNFIRINYQRELKATDQPYSFSPNTSTCVGLNIEGANANTRLWRIAYHNHPTCEVEGTLDKGTLKVNVDEGKQRYVIVDISAKYPTPEWDNKVSNQDLHGDQNAYDMVILIPESRKFADEAQRLAEAHAQLQGLRVKVVDAGQIYNEFSSGTPDATAYRRYMKMLYDRAQNEADLPRYLLLFGNCLWDNRMLASENNKLSPKDYLLSFEITDGFSNPNNTTFPLGEQNSYVTDDYFGWLDDEEGDTYTRNKIDLGIGRFTCNDVATAKILVDKSIDYLKNQNTGAWKNIIYVLADNGNSNLHMNDAEVVVDQIEKSTDNNTVIKKMYIDAYTRVASGTGHSFPTVTKILQEAMKQGALIFNYTGHGNPDQLSHARILTTPDFEIANASKLPLWVMASCEISPYDSKRRDLGRVALTNPDGGAIAVMCASRSVYSNYNRILNIAYNKYLFSYDENGKRNSMGDALRLTKVDLVTPSEYGGIKDGSINKLKYLLLGNPAIPIAAPTGKVILDSINGSSTISFKNIQLKAGSLVRFSGHVANSKKQNLKDFNGSITATMMDRLETIVCKNNDKTAEEPMVYQEHTKKIFEGSDSIKNGKFNISFRIPRDISYTEDCGRITFYAVNNENTIECHGSNESFYLNGTDSNIAPDSLAPKAHLYLNTPDFPNGGVTSPNPVFFAKIQDDAGINATGSGIGHDIELVIDNENTMPIVLNDNFKYDFGSYQKGIVSYPLNGLDYGEHTLTFRVWDVNGNSTTSKLSFHIQEGVNDGFDVYATENPAKSQTNLVVNYPSEGAEPFTAKFEVYNLNGQKVWQSEDIAVPQGASHGIAQWNLTTNGGSRVPAGIYLFKVKIHSNNGKKETDAKKIIILEQ